ncbi:hypothetical protein J6590_058977 [Homalodisca vitripennis]|nr:hypothetical protein J6590_058977 [Homalodisca vitripennis]
MSVVSQIMRWTTSQSVDIDSSRYAAMALLRLVLKSVLREQLDDQVEENEHDEPDYEVDYESVDIEFFSRSPKTILREQLDDRWRRMSIMSQTMRWTTSRWILNSSRYVSMALLTLVPKTVLRE